MLKISNNMNQTPKSFSNTCPHSPQTQPSLATGIGRHSFIDYLGGCKTELEWPTDHPCKCSKVCTYDCLSSVDVSSLTLVRENSEDTHMK